MLIKSSKIISCGLLIVFAIRFKYKIFLNSFVFYQFQEMGRREFLYMEVTTTYPGTSITTGVARLGKFKEFDNIAVCFYYYSLGL